MSITVRRILASLIDFYIICFVSSAVIGIITLWDFYVTPFTGVLYIVVCILLLLTKDLFCKKASPGKRIFKLKIVKQDGSEPTPADLIKRNAPIILLLPVEALLATVRNRRIGDSWAKTSVIGRDECNA